MPVTRCGAGAVAWLGCIVLSHAVHCESSPAPLPADAERTHSASAAEAAPENSEALMSSLAEKACRFMQPNATVSELQNCKINFMASSNPENGSRATSDLPPCRGEHSVTLPPRSADASPDEYRLAVLLHNSSATREELISTAIEKADQPIELDGTLADATYSVWTVPLSRAGHRLRGWVRRVLPPRLRPLPVREFNPPTQFLFQDGGLVTSISWNITEDYNCDYSAFYVCGDSQPFDSPIYTSAGSPRALEAHYLPFSTACRVSVVSVLGVSETEAVFNFTTPSCRDVRGPALCLPEQPTAVRAEATASGARTDAGELLYTVLVSWAPPEYPPDHYTILLQSTNGNYTASVQADGNTTEARMEQAELSGYYHVQVAAVSPAGLTKSRVIEALALPPKESRWAREAAWGTAACSVAALLVAVLLWLWRRARIQHQLRRHLYFEELEQNAPKEVSLDCELVFVSDAFELRSERVVLFDVLGEGAFGVVRKGWIADKSKEVAVKMLKDSPTAEDVHQFRQEMEVMKSVGAHAHIVSLLGCVTQANNMMIVVEYCARGDLLNYLRCAWQVMTSKRYKKLDNAEDKKSVDKDNYLEEKQTHDLDITSRNNFVANKLYDLHGVCETELSAVDLLSFCRQIAMGMEYLSSNRVVHRDLAARNILVCADKTVKIADFGLSRDVYQDNQYRKRGNGKLPIKWMALESLTHQIYTTQSDVWSFGIVMWETVTLGGAPYPGVSTDQLPRLLRSGYRMQRPYNCAPELYELMRSCWTARPKERPKFSELHHKLDSLLTGACTEHYLPLDLLDGRELDDEQIPPDKLSKYFNFIYRNKKSTSQAATPLTFYQKYMQPLKHWRSQHALLNHYSLTPKHSLPSHPNTNLLL